MTTQYTPEQLQQMSKFAASAYPKDANAASKILANAQNNPQMMQQLQERYAYKFGGPQQTDRGMRDISLDNMVFSALNDGSAPNTQTAAPTPTPKPASGSGKGARSSNSAADNVPIPQPKPTKSSPSEEAAEGSNDNPAEENKETQSSSGLDSAAAIVGILAATGYGTAYGADKAWQVYSNRMSADPTVPKVDEQTFNELLPAPEEMKLLTGPKTNAQALPTPDVIYGNAPNEQGALPSSDVIYGQAPDTQQALPDYYTNGGVMPAPTQTDAIDQSAGNRINQAFDAVGADAGINDMVGAALNDGIKPTVRIRAEPNAKPRIRVPAMRK